jgi:hypothetical protein
VQHDQVVQDLIPIVLRDPERLDQRRVDAVEDRLALSGVPAARDVNVDAMGIELFCTPSQDASSPTFRPASPGRAPAPREDAVRRRRAHAQP